MKTTRTLVVSLCVVLVAGCMGEVVEIADTLPPDLSVRSPALLTLTA